MSPTLPVHQAGQVELTAFLFYGVRLHRRRRPAHRPEEAVHLTGADGQIDLPERSCLAESFHQALGLECVAHTARLPAATCRPSPNRCQRST